MLLIGVFQKNPGANTLQTYTLHWMTNIHLKSRLRFAFWYSDFWRPPCLLFSTSLLSTQISTRESSGSYPLLKATSSTQYPHESTGFAARFPWNLGLVKFWWYSNQPNKVLVSRTFKFKNVPFQITILFKIFEIWDRQNVNGT